LCGSKLAEGIGVVKNMFKQNIKRKKKKITKTSQCGTSEKQSKTEKTMECTFMPNRMGCAQKRKNTKSKYT